MNQKTPKKCKMCTAYVPNEKKDRRTEKTGLCWIKNAIVSEVSKCPKWTDLLLEVPFVTPLNPQQENAILKPKQLTLL